MRALQGLRVIDFSNLLPGPMATLILAEAGAEVIKVERPPIGDEARMYYPRFSDTGVQFALLNRGKRSIAIDLKQSDAVRRLEPLLRRADVLVEQFRPGVMDRLGLGYDALASINPRLIYCSITGYGQSGPKAQIAAHDLNYASEVGLLAQTLGPNGLPAIPPTLIADIGAGAYPAVINILLALQLRASNGQGRRIDVSMSDNLFPFLFRALGGGATTGTWPLPGQDLVTGASPRYQVYKAADGRFIAAAPIEQRFWDEFCDIIELPLPLRNDARDPAKTIEAIRELFAKRTSAEWVKLFTGRDVCATLVATVEEACADGHFRGRGLFDHRLKAGDQDIPALPVPVDVAFRTSPGSVEFPRLG